MIGKITLFYCYSLDASTVMLTILIMGLISLISTSLILAVLADVFSCMSHIFALV